MGNALSSQPLTPPTPPDIPTPATGGNPLAGPMPSGPQAAPSQQQQQPFGGIPAPTHAQTVAALRHFTAIEDKLSMAMQDPDLGKTDIRSKVIDEMTDLVAEGIFSAPDAVKQMGTFPDKPYEQRAWINQHFMQAVQAQQAVLAHHQFGVATGQNVQPNVEANPDDHLSTIASLNSRYAGGAGGS